MKSIIKYLLFVFVVLLIISSIVAFFNSPFAPKEEIALSTLVQQINEGKVKEIIVRGDMLDITLKDSDKKEQSKKEPGVGLTETLVNFGLDKSKINEIVVDIKKESGVLYYISNLLPVILPFIFVLVIFWFMFNQAQRGAMNAFSFSRSKAKLATDADGKKKTMFKDVAGLTEAKEEISEVVEFLRDPKRFQKLGARIPHGILLIGSPGTGKTLLAKAVANEANVPFYFVSGSEFVEMFVGVGANRVRDTFETAKRTSPSIIFVDEIDAVGRHRGAGLGGGHDEREQTLNQILVEMDGFDTDSAVIVLAATNRPDILDPALLRPGRFDRRITLDPPSIKDRQAILELHAAEKPFAEGVDLRVVAERTPGFSGADLANLINEAAILAARKDQKVIEQDNILQAIEKVMLGPERRSNIMNPKEKEIVAFHEAGHALVASSLPNTDPVHKVTIISRGRAGGYTLKLPSEEKSLRSKAEFESELAVLMGGYTAEQMIFKDITTGASNDLKVASDLARKMITQYGMSEKLGPIVFGEKEEMVFLGKELAGEKNYSDDTARHIDAEISHLLSEALKKAKEILTAKIEKLNLIARELIAKETLEQEDFMALVN